MPNGDPATRDKPAVTLTIGHFQDDKLVLSTYVSRYGNLELSIPNQNWAVDNPFTPTEMRLIADVLEAFSRLQQHLTGDPQ